MVLTVLFLIFQRVDSDERTGTIPPRVESPTPDYSESAENLLESKIARILHENFKERQDVSDEIQRGLQEFIDAARREGVHPGNPEQNLAFSKRYEQQHPLAFPFVAEIDPVSSRHTITVRNGDCETCYDVQQLWTIRGRRADIRWKVNTETKNAISTGSDNGLIYEEKVKY